VIFFNVKEARNCLESKGIVYTLRGYKRRTGIDTAVFGNFYKHEKIGKVKIKFVKKVHRPEDLVDFVELSGFNSTQEWFNKALKLHKTLPMFLFKVELLPF